MRTPIFARPLSDAEHRTLTTALRATEALPARHAWAEPDQPLRLVEQAVARDDPEQRALACSGLLLVWDNASWHGSQAVRIWIRDHNRRVKASRRSVRLIRCLLPIKSPWLNPIEPRWLSLIL